MWDESKPSEILFVLSMHRSGSSALTRVLSLLGYKLPKTLIKDNASNRRGHWESRPVVQLNDAYLQKADLVWSDWKAGDLAKVSSSTARDFLTDLRNTISDEFTADQPAVLKDPRMCRLVPAYREAFENKVQTQAIIVVRNPLEVVASLAHRNELSDIDAALLWLRHVVDAVEGSQSMSRAFVTYDQLVSGPENTVAALQSALNTPFPVAYDHAKSDIEDFLSEGLRNHALSTEDVLHSDLTYGWISDVYEAVRLLTKDPENATALQTIADVTTAFNASERMLEFVSRSFGEDISEAKRKVAALTANAELRKSQVASLREQVEEAETRAEFERSNIERLLQDANDTLAERDKDLAETQARLTAAEKTLSKTKTQHAKTQADLSALQAERDALEIALNETRAALDLSNATAEALQEQEAKHTSDTEKRIALIERLKGEVSQQKDVFWQLRNKYKALEGKAGELNTQRKFEKQRANSEEARAIRAEAATAKAQGTITTQEDDLAIVWKRATKAEEALALSEAGRATAEAGQAEAERIQHAITTSTTWRLTGPLRSLIDLLRGNRPAVQPALSDTVAIAPVEPVAVQKDDELAPPDQEKPTPPPSSDVSIPEQSPIRTEPEADTNPLEETQTDTLPEPHEGETEVAEPDPNVALIAESPYFDRAYYVSEYPETEGYPGGPAAHYLVEGWRRGFNPSAGFVTRAYQHSHADILLDDECPLVHMLKRYPDGTSANQPIADKDEKPLKIAVFSAISSGYDTLREPVCPPEGADFYLFADGPTPPDGSVWQKRDFEYVDSDPVRTARFVKTHPHLYFGDYDFAIWMDANLTLRSDPRTLLPDPGDDHAISTWPHPLRDCIYDEGNACIDMNKDDQDTIRAVLDGSERDNYPKKAGMFETSVMVTQMDAEGVSDFYSRWWARIDQGSRRDQLSLPVVVHETGMELGEISHKRICMRSDPRVDYAGHRQAAE